MSIKLICLFLNLILITNGKQKTLDQKTDFDFLMENPDPIYTNVERNLRNPAEPENDNLFTVVAPGILKSNRKYTAIVSLHKSTKPCTIRLTITGATFTAVEEVTLQPLQTKMVDFDLPKLVLDAYTLKAEGINGCSFWEETPLLVEADAGPKIYIQTDKAVYKPEDLVQFRVLLLDEHTKPLNIAEPILVEIMDSKENIVKQFKDIRFTKGIHTNSFKISSRPVMGSWSIRVSLSGKYSHSSSKSIKVQKYVLPKFSVHIKAPKHILTTDNALKAIIYGKYTFGKYVEGMATVQLRNKYNERVWLEQKVNVKTLAGVEFSLADLNQLTMEDSIDLVVLLRENLTGITRNETMEIKRHTYSYNIIVDDKDFEFNDLEPYSLKVRIEHWNGAAVLNRNTPVILKHGKNTYESYMQDNGLTTFEFKHQPNDGYLIYFKDSNTYIPNVYRSAKEDKTKNVYFKLNLINERLHLEAPVRINVTSNNDIPYLIYAVVGHGNIIRMQHIKLQSHQKSYILNIKPTIEMIPESHVFVYYYQNGILRYNEIELMFPKEFENQISVLAPQEIKPGQEITIELKAKPQSLVALLAIDMGVYLLDPSYDLDRNKILNDMAEDKSYISSELLNKSKFLYSGLIILTNIKQEIVERTPKKTIRQSEKGEPDYRIHFPEVWIFQNIEVNTTNTKMSFKAPDSITTWRLTAFSINEKSGFGMVHQPTDIIAIKPFFITLNLPYSIKWGEIVALPVLVFNYHHKTLDSTIIMANSEQEFEFMESGYEKSKEQKQQMFKSSVPSNNGKLFTFYIKPLKIGNINIKITATNHLYTDAIHQTLKVESEGIEQKKNQPIYINLNKEKPIETTSLSVEIPPDVEPASSGIDLSVGGDYIVPTLDNLDKLVDMPTGCGEQNMVHFAPNILILQYLKATGGYRKERALVNTIKSYIDIGYQQQLSYRYMNGGYSVFGESVDNEASTWLTAYTIRFFIKASKYASIEERIIETGLEYLASTQLGDGSFPYTGYLFNPAQENSYGLTAFILATFLEDGTYARKYQNVIDNGLQFLTKNPDNIQDLYSLSIVAFVLQLAKNSSANKVLQKLQNYRKQDTDNGLTWWSDDSNNFRENDVEITSYILMALLDSNKPLDLLPILKWLIKQRNDKGGFHSTHDTVVGLQALVKFAQKMTNLANVNVDIEYTATDEKGQEVKKGVLKVQQNNFLTAQTEKLPISTRNVSIEMSGRGSALLQLSHHYKLLDGNTIYPSNSTIPKWRKKYGTINTTNEKVTYFVIEPKVNIVNENDIDLEICFASKINT